MENTLNVGHMNPNGTRNAAGWVASSHGYDLDAQGRRVTHRERLKRAGNWNGWPGRAWAGSGGGPDVRL